jgi:uncharacterized membrane protein YeaQ/YmgE (transglycosylase-associated protein family)
MINTLDLMFLLLVAIPCGLLGHFTSTYARKGWILYVGVAFAGALLGLWVGRSGRVPTVYEIKAGTAGFPILWAMIGSVFMVAGLGFFIKPSRR